MDCKSCKSTALSRVLDLGTAPASNAYLTAASLEDPEVWLPLALDLCMNCSLLQISHERPPDELFTSEYAYFSSASSSWIEHARKFAVESCQRLSLGASSLVVEIASNDGYLLQMFEQAGVPAIGVEPTDSTARVSLDKGHRVVQEFFDLDLAREMKAEFGGADLIVANNVVAHVPELASFIAGLAHLMRENGAASIEVPSALRMIQKGSFDTVYHEHYSYFTLTSLTRALLQAGLWIDDVEELPTHGGSIRVLVRKGPRGEASDNVQRLLSLEEQCRVEDAGAYSLLQEVAEATKFRLLNCLLTAHQQEMRVMGYGAAAKGNTLINFAGVRRDLLPAVADASPGKVGRYLPGSRIPVISLDDLILSRPDVILVLAWNLIDEIRPLLMSACDWGPSIVTLDEWARELGV